MLVAYELDISQGPKKQEKDLQENSSKSIKRETVSY